MTMTEINKRYSEIVMDHMNDGFYINTTTMSGSQGEIAHIDLTDGSTIIRIVMSEFRDWEANKKGIEIIVGKCTDTNVKANSKSGYNTVWNNKLEVIRSEKFYQIGRQNRSYEKFYGTEEEAGEAMRKMNERYESRKTQKIFVLPDKAKKIILPFIKRQPKCKSVKIADIEKVWRNGKNEYFVTAKGKTYRIK
jgi:hypothetical protein